MPLAFLLLVPMVVLKWIRRMGVHRFPLTARFCEAVGFFPLRAHYYEPPIKVTKRMDFDAKRSLEGVDFNLQVARSYLADLRFQAEFRNALGNQRGPHRFDWENQSFGRGDADLLYAIIRHEKPKKIIEIGSGYSTLITCMAVEDLQRGSPGHMTHVRCIEPYEMPWLESLPVDVIRKPVEDIETALFDEFSAADIVFIDSSHVIKPQGDVLFEMFDILPRLRSGTLVHFHDIFSPRDYPGKWVMEEKRFWNEQYLLEAYLSYNANYEIVLPVNLLFQDYYEELASACLDLRKEDNPSSFWMRRR